MPDITAQVWVFYCIAEVLFLWQLQCSALMTLSETHMLYTGRHKQSHFSHLQSYLTVLGLLVPNSASGQCPDA